ncbi:MAG TPA: hypothetical protein PLN21_19055 [Gemmatales bacterium]|nr:hypothetical protein [Gemmatales bacterium]
MDKNLYDRMIRHQSPFDKRTLVNESIMSLENLRDALAKMLPVLEESVQGQLLFAFDDWLEHDGFISDRTETTWEHLASCTSGVGSLITNSPGDAYVRRAIYPGDCSFLFRYYVDDEEGAEVYGDFDLTASPDLIAAVRKVLPVDGSVQWKVEAAREFFERRAV